MMDLTPATVTSAAPLRVKTDGSATDTPATVLDRGGTYVPAIGNRVLCVLFGGRLYVLGGGLS